MLGFWCVFVYSHTLLVILVWLSSSPVVVRLVRMMCCINGNFVKAPDDVRYSVRHPSLESRGGELSSTDMTLPVYKSFKYF